MFGEQLAHRAHELTPRVNLEKLRPLQCPPSVDARQSIGDLFSLFCGQRLGLFVARGHINDRESIAEGFPPNAVVWQKEQIRLVDLVGHRHVKLRPRYAPWGRQIDLPDGLPFEPQSPLLKTPASRWLQAPSSSLGGCSIELRAYCRPLLLRYSSSLTSLQHADATGSGSCPVVARRLVGPARTPAANRMAARSSCRQSSSDFCSISIMVWARGPGILWRRAACPTSSIARYSSSASIASIFPTLKKFKRAMKHGLLGESVGDLAVFLAVTRVIKVGELGLGPQGVEVVPGDLRIFLHCSVNIPERLNSMTLLAKFLIDKVEALGPFPGP